MVKLYVEGGGDAAVLKAACRRGFSDFLGAAGLPSRPRIVACGTRRNAYEQFCLALAAGDSAFLLVDSESPVVASGLDISQSRADGPHPWHHLQTRSGDGWDKPANAEEKHCHLMVQCMESWLVADPGTLARFFGQGFAIKALPKAKNIETVDKAAIYAGLAKATKACRTKAPYGKGEHSFKLLASTDPAKVAAASPWAARFIATLKAETAP